MFLLIVNGDIKFRTNDSANVNSIALSIETERERERGGEER